MLSQTLMLGKIEGKKRRGCEEQRIKTRVREGAQLAPTRATHLPALCLLRAGTRLPPRSPAQPYSSFHIRPADGHKESFWSDGNSLDLDCGDGYKL